MCVSIALAEPRVRAWRGSSPTIDGIIEAGEWDDAERVDGAANWLSEFSAVNNTSPPHDLDASFLVKHDGTSLYFAIIVTDDTVFGVDVARWVPSGNPIADALNQSGWPWFGDEAEILLNPRGTWSAVNETAVGNGSSFQMVVNSGKSRLHGIGIGGLLEGEPRSSSAAWTTYSEWIASGAQRAAVRINAHVATGGASVWVAEWGIAFNPCVEVRPGHYYRPHDYPDGINIGLNVAIGDVDDARYSRDENPYGIRHEQWWSGTREGRTRLSEFGTLVLEPGPRTASSA